MRVPLSTSDLPVFFADRHAVLAARLSPMATSLIAVENQHEGIDCARAVANEMARQGLFEWLLPDRSNGQNSTARDRAEAPERAAAEPGTSSIDVRALCLIREFLGYVSPLADAIFAVQGLGSYPLAVAGQGQAMADILTACRHGQAIGAFALTEPEAGSDVASLTTRARQVETTRYVLDGKKTLISNVGIASHYVVFANTDPSAGRKGITAFLVKRGAPGLTETAIELNIDHPIGALEMRECEAELLGQVGGGFRLAMQTLDTFRVSVGAAAVGMARRALDAAVEHVCSRKQFGERLADQPVVQSDLATIATELDAARLLVLRAAHARDSGRQRVTTEAAMAKLYATEAAQRVIDRAVQLFGGRGVMAGEVVETLYRAIRPLRIYEGTSEIQRLIIGRALVKG
ncbi:MAG: acyl-CoA dehydrogenase family protein [Proteobacteria bacterium]|nr:acyl-CoA dehydrogenase family protein [Pseudomonadota bacterium]